MRAYILVLLVATIIVGTSGCASIVHGTTQVVPVNSSPTGADVKVNCGKKADATTSLKTPTTVTLKRNAEPCNITLSKEGYEDASMVFLRKMSGWFWGNLLIGGIIGMIIDGADGAIYNRVPESASVSLAIRTLRPASAEFPKGSKVYKNGVVLGEVVDTSADSAHVLLTNGVTTVWINKDQLSTTPLAEAAAPTPRAPAILGPGTKLHRDGVPFGTVLEVSGTKVRVQHVQGAVVTVTREEALSMMQN